MTPSLKKHLNAKKECSQNFAENINLHTDASYVWRKCKTFKNNWVKDKPTHYTQNLQT